jgi:hypothetical protein
MSTSTAELMTRTLRGHPVVLDALAAAHDAAWQSVDREILELCRRRVAALLGDNGEDGDEVGDGPEPLSAAQQACVDFAEQFVIDVASLSDAQAEAVAKELGGDGLSTFVNALLVIEQRERLRLAWSRLWPEVG